MKEPDFIEMDKKEILQKYFIYENMGVTIATEREYYTGERKVSVVYNDYAEKEWSKLY
jgi:RNA-binding protein YlmH